MDHKTFKNLVEEQCLYHKELVENKITIREEQAAVTICLIKIPNTTKEEVKVLISIMLEEEVILSIKSSQAIIIMTKISLMIDVGHTTILVHQETKLAKRIK